MRRRPAESLSRWLGSAVGLALTGLALRGAPAPTIHWQVAPATTAVEVTGVPRELLAAAAARPPGPDGWPALFGVFAEQPQGGTGVGGAAVMTPMPPMAGAWSVAGDRLRFEPSFPFTRGVRYRAEFRAGSAPPVIAYFELPADTAAPTTTVRQVFPTAGVLPENQLKFYIHFSAPMSRGGVYEHIHLLDASGRPIDLAFLELGEELWDPEMTRLTLLIDPGRIKRGVKPLEDVGPVFAAGQAYTLLVAPTCRDAAGRPLRAAFEKHFRVGPADRTPPDTRRWQLAPPPAGSRSPLTVRFDEPMDHALALRLLRVNGVDGEVALGHEERQWTLSPAEPWRPGTYQLAVATTIEDLAGNNIGKPFDVDVFAGVQREITTDTVQVEFVVR